MAISIPTKRKKSVIYNDVPTTLVAGTPVETEGAQEDKLFFPVRASAAIDPPSFTVASCTTTSGNTTVTTATAEGFKNVKVGDPVTGTGIAGGTTVAAKNANNISLTLSANATASGTVTLTFDPPAITPTYYALEVVHAPSFTGEQISISSITLHKYDGSLGGATATAANSSERIVLVPAPSASREPMSINVDAFLTNLRVPASP